MQGKLIFAGIVAFGLAEIGIGTLAATTTDVGSEYRAFFIDASTGCLPRKVSGNYTLGTTLILDSGQPVQPFEDVLVCGFENPMVDGTWLRGAEGRLRFALGHAPATDLELRLTGYALVSSRWPRQQLTVLANGHEVGVAMFEGKVLHDIAVTIPKSVPLTSGGLLELELRMLRLPYEAPEKKDSRRPSLMINSLWLGPA
jgi:hypothetical protein